MLFPINMKKQHAILVVLLLCGMATSLHAQTPSTLNALAAESITAGISHTCVLINGAGKCWGANFFGQLGDGTFAGSQIRRQVVGLTTNVVAISAGGGHTCAIRNGAAKCWGGNGFGVLGRGFSENSFHTSQLVNDLETSVTAIAAGAFHTCAVQNGVVKCWGRNDFGQLGDDRPGPFTPNDSNEDHNTPQRVVGLSTGVTAIAVGFFHSCSVDNGAVKCWGLNSVGQLGVVGGFQKTTSRAVQVQRLSSGVTTIAVGRDHTCAILDGAAKCWGRNLSGQLGNNTRTDNSIPVQVIGLSTGVTAIAAGNDHTCAIQDGAAKCWGRNVFGQLGDETRTLSKTPVQVVGLTRNVTAIAASGNLDQGGNSRVIQGHSCAIHQGFAKCWGSNYHSQLGNGEGSTTDPTVDRSSPVFVLDPTVPGESTQLRSVVVTANRIKVSWDPPANDGGFPIEAYIVYWRSENIAERSERVTVPNYEIVELQSETTYQIEVATVNRVGTGERSNELRVQTRLDLLSAQSITAGSAHSCALANGAARCWGNNENGRLGEAISPRRTRPGQVVGLTSSVTVIAAGGSHSCAVQNGAAKCWGSNLVGQLGRNTVMDSSMAVVQVAGLEKNITTLATGDNHSCAIQGGEAKCWGAGGSGQLGNGNNENSTMAVSVMDLGVVSVTSIAAGGNHSCVIDAGAAKCWGFNDFGQLGDGSKESTSRAVQVQGLSLGVTAIAAGGNHSCAIDAGGAKCWGAGESGQLGNGDNMNSTVAVSVVDLGPVAISAIAAGGSHSCVIDAGAAKCWGAGDSGQLGNNSTQRNSNKPVQVAGLFTGVTAIATGAMHSCAIHNDIVRCWGTNTEGQLGDGTQELSSLPTPLLLPSAPLSVSLGRVTSNSIALSWTPPDDTGIAAITGYRVYWQVVGELQFSTRVVSTHFVIADLSAGRNYQIAVVAVNRGGVGKRSPLLAVRTNNNQSVTQFIDAGE